jgi:hypothetical protein
MLCSAQGDDLNNLLIIKTENFMKRLSVIAAILGVILLIYGIVFYKSDSNAMDSAGTKTFTKNTMSKSWAPEIPVFVGGVCLLLSAVFFYASRSKTENKTQPS